MNRLFSSMRAFFGRLLSGAAARVSGLWRRYRALRPRYQWIIGILALIFIVVFFSIVRGGGAPASSDNLRAVSLEEVGALSGGNGSATLFGTVASVTEAEVLAKTSGTVRAVNARLGQTVPAGYVLASLENDAESAAVLSAEGSYDAAVAARSIAMLQAENAEDSLEETETSARNAYRSAYTTVDSAIQNHLEPLTSGVDRVEGAGKTEKRNALIEEMRSWRYHLNSVDVTDPMTLLNEAERITRQASDYANDFARIVNDDDSGATATQRAGVASARQSIEGALSSIVSARTALSSARTAASVAERQTSSTSNEVATADAQVKQALGALRSAQAAFERTVVRAPIAGTVNFLPVRIGDYVTAMTHVATVARNGALEITAYVSEDDRSLLAVGDVAQIDESGTGTITSIAPALDPVSKQIEVRIAASDASTLTNGQSVRVTLSGTPRAEAPTGPLTLPLSAVKLSAGSRVVFSVGEDMRLVSHAVEIGKVRGDRVEISSELPLSLRIVRDARGLSEGQEVRIATN